MGKYFIYGVDQRRNTVEEVIEGEVGESDETESDLSVETAAVLSKISGAPGDLIATTLL